MSNQKPKSGRKDIQNFMKPIPARMTCPQKFQRQTCSKNICMGTKRKCTNDEKTLKMKHHATHFVRGDGSALRPGAKLKRKNQGHEMCALNPLQKCISSTLRPRPVQKIVDMYKKKDSRQNHTKNLVHISSKTSRAPPLTLPPGTNRPNQKSVTCLATYQQPKHNDNYTNIRPRKFLLPFA